MKTNGKKLTVMGNNTVGRRKCTEILDLLEQQQRKLQMLFLVFPKKICYLFISEYFRVLKNGKSYLLYSKYTMMMLILFLKFRLNRATIKFISKYGPVSFITVYFNSVLFEITIIISDSKQTQKLCIS